MRNTTISKIILTVILAVALFGGVVPILPGTAVPIVSAQTTTPAIPKTAEDIECSGLVYCAMTKFFAWAAREVTRWITKIIASFITVMASFMQVMIDFNSKVLGTPIVAVGFQQTLNVANLGFVLAIIIIAIATILRYEQYHLKKTLVKLIAAALLVNFSLLIVGIPLDFANVVANSFFAQISHDGVRENMAQGLANTLDLNKLFAEDADKLKPTPTVGFLQILIAVATGLVFALLILITFIALAFMIMLRYIYIVFLVIIMPIAWLFWVIPGLAKYTEQWWSTFLKWTLFLPASAFFIWLVAFSSAKIKDNVLDAKNGPGQAISGMIIIKGGIDTFLNIFVLAGMLLGGIYAAQQIGITGAGAAMGYAKKGLQKIGMAPVKGTAAAGRAAGRALKRRFEEDAEAKRGTTKLSNALTQSPLRFIPGAAALGRKIAPHGLPSAEKATEEYGKKRNFDSYSKAQRKGQYGRASSANDIELAATLNLANKNKELDDVPANKLEEMVAAVKRLSPDEKPQDIKAIKDTLNVRPDFAAKFLPVEQREGEDRAAAEARTIAEAVARIPANKFSEISKKAFESPQGANVASAASQSQISNLYRNGADEQVKAFRGKLEETAGEELTGIRKEIDDLQKQLREAKGIDENSPETQGLQTELKKKRVKLRTMTAEPVLFDTDKAEEAQELVEGTQGTLDEARLKEQEVQRLRSTLKTFDNTLKTESAKPVPGQDLGRIREAIQKTKTELAKSEQGYAEGATKDLEEKLRVQTAALERVRQTPKADADVTPEERGEFEKLKVAYQKRKLAYQKLEISDQRVRDRDSEYT